MKTFSCSVSLYSLFQKEQQVQQQKQPLLLLQVFTLISINKADLKMCWFCVTRPEVRRSGRSVGTIISYFWSIGILRCDRIGMPICLYSLENMYERKRRNKKDFGDFSEGRLEKNPVGDFFSGRSGYAKPTFFKGRPNLTHLCCELGYNT